MAGMMALPEAILVTFVLFISSSFGSIEPTPTERSEIWFIGSIRIDDNDRLNELSLENGWKGNGTEEDPILIDNMTIDRGSGGVCIYIGNTTLHLIIRNCTLINASYSSQIYGEGGGVVLYNARNITIEGCNISRCNVGVQILASSDISLIDCSMTWNFEIGIEVRNSKAVGVDGCNVTWNDFGIHVLGSSEVSLNGCQVMDNDDHGALLESSSLCNVHNCTFERNDDGVHLKLSSHYNNISQNRMISCRESAIAIGNGAALNTFQGNVMHDCGFYFPDDRINIGEQSISRTNLVNGKEVLFLYMFPSEEGGLHYDLGDTGQLIVIDSWNLTLFGMDITGGSQSVVLVNSNTIDMFDISISSQIFHAFKIEGCRSMAFSVCSIDSALFGIHISDSMDILFQNITLEHNNNPMDINRCQRMVFEGTSMIGNEFGISLNNNFDVIFNGLSSSGCSNPDIHIELSSIELMDAMILSGRTSISSTTRSSVTAYGCVFSWPGVYPVITGYRSDFTIGDSEFLMSGSRPMHEIEAFSLTDCTMKWNGIDLKNFGLDPRHMGMYYSFDMVNVTVKGMPLLYVKNDDLAGGSITGEYGQIVLQGVKNAVIADVNLSNIICGVALMGCHNVTMQDSRLSQSYWGVYINNPRYINIRRSLFHENEIGMHIQGDTLESNSVIERCSFVDNTEGCVISKMNLLRMRENTFSSNTLCGIRVSHSGLNMFYHNMFLDNIGPAVLAESTAKGNHFLLNAFIRNNGSNDSFSEDALQAEDHGTNNWASTQGNFWYDLRSPDLDGDLTIDEPYPLFGSASARDPLPMARIPSVILPPPYDIRMEGSHDCLDLMWSVIEPSMIPVTGFRVYANRSIVMELNESIREYSVPFKELPYGNITMTSLCEYGESENSDGMISRSEETGPRIRRNNPDRTEYSSFREPFVVEILDPSGLGEVSWRIDDLEWSMTHQQFDDLFHMRLEGIEEGPHTIEIEARDRLWNLANATYRIIVDDSAPGMEIAYDLDGALINTSGLELPYRVNDRIGTLKNYKVRLDGEELELPLNGTMHLSGLSEGNHSITFYGMDLAGNLGTRQWDFTIDTRSPRPVSWHPIGSSVSSATIIEARFDETIVDAVLLLNGEIVPYSIHDRTIKAEGISLENGSQYQVSVSGSDLAGNRFLFSWNFTTAKDEEWTMEIRGRVIDQEGESIPGVEVWILYSLEIVTDEEGRFTVHLREGTYFIDLVHPEYTPRTLQITVSRDSPQDLGDIVLEPLDSEAPPPNGPPWMMILIATMIAIFVSFVIATIRAGSKKDYEE